MNMEQSNQFYSPFSQYSLLVMSPVSIDEQYGSSQSSWSPFSTPSISPYGSPPQRIFQYSSIVESNHSSRQISNSFLPLPIARPTIQNQLQSIQNKSNFNYKRLPKRSEQIDLSEFMQKAAIENKSTSRVKLCTFCKSNGEDEAIYKSHALKSSTNKITCPILMRYTCTECGASGENTHTIKYCPVMQKKQRLVLLNKIAKQN